MEIPVTRVQQIGSQQHNPEFVKQIVFTDDIIEFVRHVLMNEAWNKKEEKWEIKTALDGNKLNPMMNESYINDLLSMLRLCLTRFMPLSKMEKHEVNNMILITANNIDFWFALNWKAAGISKEVYYSDLLSDSLINLLQAIMKMPQDGSIQDLFKDTYRASENVGEQQQGNKPLFSMPTFFSRDSGAKK